MVWEATWGHSSRQGPGCGAWGLESERRVFGTWRGCEFCKRFPHISKWTATCRWESGSLAPSQGRFPHCALLRGPGSCKTGEGRRLPIWTPSQLVLSLGLWKADREMRNWAA